MSRLFFPNPAGPSSLPALSLDDADPTQRSAQRIPPKNFREAARILRQPKSPFLPKVNAGKEKDISGYSIEELSEQLERNAKLLDTPSITAALPGGDAKLRHHQARIGARLNELKGVRRIDKDLAATHLDDQGSSGGDSMQLTGEQGQDVEDADLSLGSASSPLTKQRITRSFSIPHPNSSVASMSLAESLELQRKAAERGRQATQRQELLRQSAERAGSSSAYQSKVADFMSNRRADENQARMAGHTLVLDPEDEEYEDEAEEDFDDEFGLSSELRLQEQAEEDEGQLNPYRSAFESGYNRDMEQEPED